MATSSVEVIVVKSFFLCLFFIVAIVGNVFVCYAIYTKKKLRTVPNYLVFNLAVADLLFGVVGMPMIIVTSIAGKWVLGDAACQVSGIISTLLCLASIWTLCVISVNRYYAVGKATSYKAVFTKRRILISIALVWFFAILMALMPAFGWSRIRAGDNFCTIDGRTDKSYATLIILFAYVAPLLIIGSIYTRIYFILRKHEKQLFKSSGKRDSYAANYSLDGSSVASEANHNQVVDVNYSVTNTEEKPSKTPRKYTIFKSEGSTGAERLAPVVTENGAALQDSPNVAARPDETAAAVADESSPENSSLTEQAAETQDRKADHTPTEAIVEFKAGDGHASASEEEIETKNNASYAEIKPKRGDRKVSQSSLSISGLRGRIAATVKRKPKTSSKRRQFVKEARITRMLFVVVLAFFVCWTPLAVGSVLYGLGVQSSEFGILNFGITMACMSSACNPVIYAFMSTAFRRAFIEIYRSIAAKTLRCAKSK